MNTLPLSTLLGVIRGAIKVMEEEGEEREGAEGEENLSTTKEKKE